MAVYVTLRDFSCGSTHFFFCGQKHPEHTFSYNNTEPPLIVNFLIETSAQLNDKCKTKPPAINSNFSNDRSRSPSTEIRFRTQSLGPTIHVRPTIGLIVFTRGFPLSGTLWCVSFAATSVTLIAPKNTDQSVCDLSRERKSHRKIATFRSFSHNISLSLVAVLCV